MAAPEILLVPPAEAIAHFRAKGLLAGFDWRDTDAAEHLRSFTVAKAMRLDVLEDIRGAVDRALAEGRTFRDFHNELEPLLRKKGWWGRQRMLDPRTGKFETVQLGSARRLRVIYDTNLRMAHARGRWERIERVAEARPWLRYVTVQDARTRPDHLAWHGTVLPWDDPFWETHYPPNGWRCRCIVQQLSDDDLEAFGYDPSSGPPPGSGETRPWFDARNDRTVRVPAGIDPGFQHNAGLANLGKESAGRLIRKIDDAGGALARAAVGSPWRTAMFRRHLAGASDGDWPVAVAPARVLGALGGRSHTVRLSGDTAAKQSGLRFAPGGRPIPGHPDVRPEDYALVQRILDDGEVFKAGPYHAAGFIESDGRLWRAVVKATEDGAETYLRTLHKARRRDLTAARRRLQRIDREGG